MTSISRRLIFWLAVPLMILALCGALVHYFNNIAPGVISSDRRLKEAASTIISHLVVKDGELTFDASAGGTPLPAPSEIKFAVFDARGQRLAGDPEVLHILIDSDANQMFSMVQFDHRSLRMLTTRFKTERGTVFISVADERSGKDPAARYGFISTLLWDFVQLDVTLVLVWIGIHLGLRPVKRLRDEIAQRSPFDLRPIVESTAPREIAPVIVTLNRLFAALRAAAQSQQHFIANTAHQLRTPIAGMQAQLDVLTAEPAAQPIRERLKILQESIRQLGHASNQLLTLARADPSANLAAKNHSLPLDELAAEITARYVDRALVANIDLGVETERVSITADASLIDDLLSNLVDNALKYTPQGGRVTVRVSAPNQQALIVVEDTGPGIPEQERQRVRQRFYRLPNSPGHGSGLGLAIVDEIAHLYGATLSIGATVQGGTRISVQFP